MWVTTGRPNSITSIKVGKFVLSATHDDMRLVGNESGAAEQQLGMQSPPAVQRQRWRRDVRLHALPVVGKQQPEHYPSFGTTFSSPTRMTSRFAIT